VFTIANVIGAGSPGSTLIDPIKSFEPVAMLGSLPNVLVAYPGTHIKTVDDLIRVAKTKPDGLSFASSGTGTSPHLAGVLFSQMTGVKMLHVPYKGSAPAVADLLGGQVDVMFAPASTALPHIVAGKLTAVASASPKRLETLPNVPTLSEMGLKGFDSSVWFGLTAPVGTPMAIRDKLAAAVKTTLDTPDIKKQLNAQGIDVVHAGPNQFKDYIQSESDKWTKVVQAAGIELQ
jgi:tripartite-type tricarboxylate transporter receptor subunit TctC